MKTNLYCCCDPGSLDLAEDMARSAYPEFNTINMLVRDWSRPTYKLHLIIAAMRMQRQLGYDYMIYADSDVLFFKPCVEDVLEKLKPLDAVFQDDGLDGVSTGFFAVKTTDKMIQWWEGLEKYTDCYGQGLINEECAANQGKGEIQYGILPNQEYWNCSITLHGNAKHQWTLYGFPQTARNAHLCCIYPDGKRDVMRQIKMAVDLWHQT